MLVVVCGHGKLLDAVIGMRDEHVRVDCRNFGQPRLFKGNPDGKINPGSRQLDHLLRFGFVAVRVCTGWHHDRDRYPVSANLLHEVLLGHNTDEDLDGLRRSSAGAPDHQNSQASKPDVTYGSSHSGVERGFHVSLETDLQAPFYANDLHERVVCQIERPTLAAISQSGRQLAGSDAAELDLGAFDAISSPDRLESVDGAYLSRP